MLAALACLEGGRGGRNLLDISSSVVVCTCSSDAFGIAIAVKGN